MKFKNRYGDVILFTKVSDNCIEMKGGDYYRAAFNPAEPDKLTMIDPSGGPYIAQGSDLGCVDIDWEGMRVDYITYNKDSGAYNLHVKEQ